MVVGDITTGTDVLVIGAGPAGYVAAIRAAQLDLDVTLVEKDAYGGTCLNRGCIPSKALIHGSKLAHDAATAEELGIHADPAVDLTQMTNWKDDVVSTLTGGVEKLCKANGVTLLEGRAVFADANTVRIVHGGDGQGSESLSFEHCIVATGSRPIQIPNFEFADEPVLSSRGALELDSLPEQLVVVGAGYIGMELAGVYARLGTDVTVVELLERPLPNYEADVARVVTERAEELGVEFHYGYSASDWEWAGAGDGGGDGGGDRNEDGIVVRAEPADGAAATDGGTEAVTAEREPLELPADRVLVAVGRQPVTDTLELGAAGLETDDRGFVPTDDRCRTAVDHIFAVGDVAGEPMLAHNGSAEGQVAAECIAGEPAALDAQAIPAAVFTSPEIATVGLTEAEAADDGFDPLVGTFPFQASGRALSTTDTDGFVRIVADADSGFVLGGQIVGAEASELIAEVTHAIEMGATLEELAATVHTHPTRSEAVMEAAEHALGQAIHTLNR